MVSECPVCNTASVVEEEVNGHIHHVCVECGHIAQEESVLTNDAPDSYIQVWAIFTFTNPESLEALSNNT